MSTILSNAYEGRYLQLEVWEISADAAANSSLVGWRLSSLGGHSSYYYIADTAVTLGDQTVYAYDAPAWDTNWAAKTFPVKTGEVSGQLTVPHNPDGRKTLSVSLSTRVYISTTPAVFSGSLTLTDIPPAQSVPLQAEDAVLGEICPVTWTPADPALYYKLLFVLGSKYQSVSGIWPGRTTPYTFRGVALSPLLAQGIPTAASGELTVTLSAHSEEACTQASQVGQPLTARCTVTVPRTADFLPELSLALSPWGSQPEAFAGLFLQGKTPIAGVLTAQAKQGASLQSFRLSTTGADDTGTEGDLLLPAPGQYGSFPVTAAVQDSRGFEASLTQTIQVLPYARPRIQSLSGSPMAFRCDADGAPSDTGAFLRVQARRSYSGNGGVDAATVRKAQAFVGADADGMWGSKSKAAAKAKGYGSLQEVLAAMEGQTAPTAEHPATQIAQMAADGASEYDINAQIARFLAQGQLTQEKAAQLRSLYVSKKYYA